jgi:hypothetical protein
VEDFFPGNQKGGLVKLSTVHLERKDFNFVSKKYELKINESKKFVSNQGFFSNDQSIDQVN